MPRKNKQETSNNVNGHTSPVGIVKKRHARFIDCVRDRKSNAIIGWEYEWNNGESDILWKSTTHNNIVNEPPNVQR